MPFNGAGVFSRIYSWITDAGNGVPITPSRMDGESNDVATALSNCVTRDGQGFFAADINANGFGIKNLAFIKGPSAALVGTLDSSGNITFSANVNLLNLNGGQLAGLRNALINGAFLVNQRAVSGTVTLAAGAYGHDRWKAGAGGCTYTFATAAGVTTITITAGTLQQVIEGSNILTQTYTLGWTGTAQGRINSGSYGTSGAVSAALTAGTNQTVEFNTGTLAYAQLEPGAKATSFELRSYAAELTLCQRYLPAASGAVPIGVGMSTTTTAGTIFVPHQVQPRVAPTGAYVSAYGAFTITNSAGGAVTPNNIAYNSGGLLGTFLTIGAASGLVAGGPATLAGNAAGALILFTGCEL